VSENLEVTVVVGWHQALIGYTSSLCVLCAYGVVGWHQALIGYTWWEGVLLVVVVVGWHQALIGYTEDPPDQVVGLLWVGIRL